jgi:hypothetical protein
VAEDGDAGDHGAGGRITTRIDGKYSFMHVSEASELVICCRQVSRRPGEDRVMLRRFQNRYSSGFHRSWGT